MGSIYLRRFCRYNESQDKFVLFSILVPRIRRSRCFVFNWSDHNCWIVPLVRLICRAISHLALCRSHGILIIPKWPSSAFWPLLWSSEDNNFQQFVRNHIEYVKRKGFFKLVHINTVFSLLKDCHSISWHYIPRF